MSTAPPPPLPAATAVHVVARTTLTEANAEAFERELAGLAAAAHPNLVLDLAAVEFLSSMTLSQFVRLNKTLQAGGGRLTLVNVRPTVRQVFAITRLDGMLDVHASQTAG